MGPSCLGGVFSLVLSRVLEIVGVFFYNSIMMKRNVILLLLLTFAVLGFGETDDVLVKVLTEKQWEKLPALFLDDGHSQLKEYFFGARSVVCAVSRPNQLAYTAKFPRSGEMGVLVYEKKNGKYLNLKIKNQIKPLHFIETYKKYSAAGIRLTLGDARIHFINGTFYEPLPFGKMLVFKGTWKISITPGDEEERLTLKRKYRDESFERTEKTGIFMLQERDFLDRLPVIGQSDTPDEAVKPLLDLYRTMYGIDIKAYNESWYLPFSEGSNLVLFRKDKKSHYYFSYNENLVPDTQLLEYQTSNIILSYNAHRGLKFNFGEKSATRHMALDVYYDPLKGAISGTNTVSYKQPAALRQLKLKKGLNLVRNLSRDTKGVSVFRKKEIYYLMGSEDTELSFYFSGGVRSGEESMEYFKPTAVVTGKKAAKGEPFYFLSREHNFYPNPGDEFFAADVTVKLPDGLNCLASGSRVAARTGEAPVFVFRTTGTKGVSLVVGDFKRTRELASRIPLHLYTYDSFKYPKRLNLQEVKEGFDFYINRFGAPDLTAVNVLLKRARLEGGVSNNGFVVVNLPFVRGPMNAMRGRIALEADVTDKVISPVLIRDKTEDHILHELAHQWWGGIISWKSYRDVWLTEGLAHFSVLYYLKHKLSKKDFTRLVKKLRRWVYRYSNTGPIVYGTRINLLEGKYEAYQAVVYNKGALVLLMLADLLGEEEFDRRLRSVVENSKYRSLSTWEFIRKFSGDNKMVSGFLQNWLFKRAIPTVELVLDYDDKETDNKKFKQVVLIVKQVNTDYIFPLKLRVMTRKGTSTETVVITQKEQRVVIRRGAGIRIIDILDTGYLVKEKRSPPAA